MERMTERDRETGFNRVALGVGCGPFVLIAGVLLTFTGFFFIGLPLIGMGGMMLFGAGSWGTAMFKESDTGQRMAAGIKSAAASVRAESEKATIRSRAGKVIAQLQEQLDAGAISTEEFQARAMQVHSKMNADIALLDSEAGS